MVLGKARRSVRNSWISVPGVLVAMNSASVRFSTSTFLPRCVERASCMWNPNHIWPIMSIPRVATRLDLVFDVVGVVLLGIVDVAV